MLLKLRLLLLAPLWLACQSDDPASEFSSEPDLAAYNDEAPLLKKIYCSDGKCRNPYAEENYIYNSEAKLTKVEYFGSVSADKMEIQNYTEHIYNQNGELTGKIQYGRNGSGAGWVAENESGYEYTNGVLTSEKTFFNRPNPDQKVLTGQITYQYEGGKKQGRKWYDAKNNLYQRVAYGYKNKVLNRETWYDGHDNVIRIFEHKFSGNRRQIGEYILNSEEQLALIERVYDEKGRLSTQETKVANMLLCAMTPGLVRYSY